MSDIVDLATERNKRDEPDPALVMRDDFGRLLYLFGLDYEFDGREWMTELWAYSFEDAEARVAAMRQSLKVVGQKMSEVPA